MNLQNIMELHVKHQNDTYKLGKYSVKTTRLVKNILFIRFYPCSLSLKMNSCETLLLIIRMHMWNRKKLPLLLKKGLTTPQKRLLCRWWGYCSRLNVSTSPNAGVPWVESVVDISSAPSDIQTADVIFSKHSSTKPLCKRTGGAIWQGFFRVERRNVFSYLI